MKKAVAFILLSAYMCFTLSASIAYGNFVQYDEGSLQSHSHFLGADNNNKPCSDVQLSKVEIKHKNHFLTSPGKIKITGVGSVSVSTFSYPAFTHINTVHSRITPFIYHTLIYLKNRVLLI